MQSVTEVKSRLKEFGEAQKAFFEAVRTYKEAEMWMPNLGGFGLITYIQPGFTQAEINENKKRTYARINERGARYLEIASIMTSEEKFIAVFGTEPRICVPSNLKKYGIKFRDGVINWGVPEEMRETYRAMLLANAFGTSGGMLLLLPPGEILHTEHNVKLAEDTFDGKMVPFVVNTMAELYRDPKPASCGVKRP